VTVDRSIMTLALGKPIFATFAANLVRSFRLWNDPKEVRVVVVTDQPDRIPLDVRRVAEIVIVSPGEYGHGFSPKLHLDRFLVTDQTLFIDADSLCVASVDALFERFAGRAVSVIGQSRSSGEWFGDIATTCRGAGVQSIPVFVGGVYYLERGPLTTSVYERARALESSYDAIGLIRLRGRPNEEPLVAIAMAQHGLDGILDDGTLKAEPVNFPCGVDVDVFRGRATLLNTPHHPRYEPRCPLSVAEPRVVHFCSSHADRRPYTTEAARLERVFGRGWPRWAASAYALATRELPEITREAMKDLLRPAYRAVFGYRPVAASNRL
jgi:hypothetical protein